MSSSHTPTLRERLLDAGATLITGDAFKAGGREAHVRPGTDARLIEEARQAGWAVVEVKGR